MAFPCSQIEGNLVILLTFFPSLPTIWSVRLPTHSMQEEKLVRGGHFAEKATRFWVSHVKIQQVFQVACILLLFLSVSTAKECCLALFHFLRYWWVHPEWCSLQKWPLREHRWKFPVHLQRWLWINHRWKKLCRYGIFCLPWKRFLEDIHFL